MPKNKTLVSVSVKGPAAPGQDATQPETEEGREVVEQAERDAERAAVEGSRGAVTTVFRIAENGAEVWCGEYASRIVTRKFIADKHGGGTYLCKTRIPTGKGSQTRIGSQFTFEIDPAVRPVAEVSAGGGSVEDSLSLHRTLSELVRQNMDSMRAYQEVALQSARALSESRRTDWGTIAPALAPVLVALVEGILRRPRGGEGNELVIALIEMLQDRRADRHEPDDPVALVERFRALKDALAGELGDKGKGSKETQAFELMGRALSVAEKIFAGQGKQPAAGPGALRPENRVADIGAVPLPESEAPPAMPAQTPLPADLAPWRGALLDGLGRFGAFAFAMPPRAAADTILHNVDPAIVDQFKADADAAFEGIKAKNPGVEDDAAELGVGVQFAGELEPYLGDWPADRLAWLAEVLGELVYFLRHPEPEEPA
jgi:hypothetical protein